MPAPPLPGSTGLPIQFVINTTGGFDALNDVAQKFLQDALATGRFIFLNTDLKIDAPQATSGPTLESVQPPPLVTAAQAPVAPPASRQGPALQDQALATRHRLAVQRRHELAANEVVVAALEGNRGANGTRGCIDHRGSPQVGNECGGEGLKGPGRGRDAP